MAKGSTKATSSTTISVKDEGREESQAQAQSNSKPPVSVSLTSVDELVKIYQNKEAFELVEWKSKNKNDKQKKRFFDVKDMYNNGNSLLYVLDKCVIRMTRFSTKYPKANTANYGDQFFTISINTTMDDEIYRLTKALMYGIASKAADKFNISIGEEDGDINVDKFFSDDYKTFATFMDILGSKDSLHSIKNTPSDVRISFLNTPYLLDFSKLEGGEGSVDFLKFNTESSYREIYGTVFLTFLVTHTAMSNKVHYYKIIPCVRVIRVLDLDGAKYKKNVSHWTVENMMMDFDERMKILG